ncbi:MAG: SpoIIE family protein phosphatase [Actinomycetota bacterium]|nr:SpoIIE family protein phosphatase [Actinomycetota bacterium]
MPEVVRRPDFLDWGVAQCSIPGNAESGDASVVAHVPDGLLVAVVDGLGHGGEAAQAAHAALKVLKEHAGEKLPLLIERCHEALRYSRGAVMTLAQVNLAEEAMTWLGVGNVEGRLLRARPSREKTTESPLLRGGVVGHKLPSVHPTTVQVSRGDLLILATDGVSAGFVDHLAPEGTPQQIADTILAEHWRGVDDALVLVARYLGKS